MMSKKFKCFDNRVFKLLKKRPFFVTGILLLLLGFTIIKDESSSNHIATGEKPLIFPIPLDVQFKNGNFLIDKTTFILVPEKKNEIDDFLAGLLFNEMVDKYKQPLPIVKRSVIPAKDKFILIGDLTNPLVKRYVEKNGLLSSLKALGNEGYILSVSGNNIVVAANHKSGALYGLQSLRQIIQKNEKGLFVPQLLVKDSPRYEFRGIRLYVPGRENIPYFKRFIKDFVSHYKFNKIIMEFNANMRLEKRPELNIGTVEFARYLNFSRLNRPTGPNGEGQTSSHHDVADGGILEKEEVADLVNYIKKFNIEVIPELPSLTHAYYLLFGNEHLAESMHYDFPDNYCPLKTEVYQVYFDVLDEYIDVIKPGMIHIGHDEWRMEKDVCELCRGKDYGQLFADDLTKIHGYLAKKGIKTAMWGDHLLESVRGKDYRDRKTSTGYEYKIPGAMRPEQVIKLIPKDILVFNWAWHDINNDKQYSDFGFKQIYGNFRPGIDNWDGRSGIKGVIGGAPSSWAATTELNDGKDMLFDFLGTSNLLWSKHYVSVRELTFTVEPLISGIRTNLSGKYLPSDVGSKVQALDIASHFNSSLSEGIDSLNYSDLLAGLLKKDNKIFSLFRHSGKEKKAITVYTKENNPGSGSIEGIEVNKDVNSILFLHASAKAAINTKSYFMIHNPMETAQLLGWYEIIYEDGIIESIPVRYGLNILDWQWVSRITDIEKPVEDVNQNKYAYQASAIECSRNNSQPITFFAFEWENKRFGVPIKEINLKPAKFNGKNENAIILLAMSISSTVAIEDEKVVEDY
jgi:hypothetical protein